MQAIFVGLGSSQAEIRDHIRRYPGESVLVQVSEPVLDCRRFGSCVLRLEEFAPPRGEVWNGLNNWLRSWSNKPILNEKNLKQALVYRGMSVWWMMDTWLLWAGIMPPPFEDVLHTLEAAHNLLAALRPQRVVSLDQGEMLNTILEICSRGLGICSIQLPGQTLARMKTYAGVRAMAAGYWLRFVVRKFLFRFQEPLVRGIQKRTKKAPGPTILVVSRDDWEPVLDLKSGRLRTGERHYQTIVDSLSEQVRFVFSIHLHKFRLGMSYFLRKARSGCWHEPMEATASLWRVLLGCRELRHQWRLLRQSPQLWNTVSYKGLDCAPLLKPRFDAFFLTGLVEAMVGFDAAAALMQRERPALVFHGLETSAVGKAFIHAARRQAIPTLSLQHGSAMAGHPAGTPGPEDVGLDGSRADAWPLPDRMAVYGRAAREALIQSNWPEHLIHVTGAPRWDFLTQPDRFYSKRRICQRLGLDAEAPIVLFLSSILSPLESDAVCKVVCQAVRRLGYQLIVKLHPHDRHERRVRRVLRAHGMNKAPVFRKCTLPEFVLASDIVVSVGSTAVIEAALLGRPVVTVDPNGCGYANLFSSPFVKSAATTDDLSRLLKGYFEDHHFRREWMEARDHFVREHCHCDDGKATSRVIALIRDMLEGVTFIQSRVAANPEPEPARPGSPQDFVQLSQG